MPRLDHTLAVLAALSLLGGCSGGHGSESPGDGGDLDGGPVPSTMVGFSPADLTTAVGPDSALSVLLTDRGGALPPLDELERAVELVSVDGASVAGDVTAGPSTEAHAAELRYRAVEPLADGWYELRFADRFDEPFFVDGRVGVELEPSLFVARLRVGSQPFLRAVTLCLAGGERPPMVHLEFSESVVSTDGEDAALLNDDGTLACALGVEAASAYPGVECRALDPGGLTLELPSTIESLTGVALQRGPDGAAPPPQYRVDASSSGPTGCARFPVVPEESLAPATATH